MPDLTRLHKELVVDKLLLVIREVTVTVKEGHHIVLRPLLQTYPVTKLRLALQQDEAVSIWS